MAKMMNYTWKGIPFANGYFRIGNVQNDRIGALAVIRVDLYADQTARQANLQENILTSFQFYANGDNYNNYFKNGVDDAQSSYEMITAQSDGLFTGSSDILEPGQPYAVPGA